MSQTFTEEALSHAIHSEIHARDLYQEVSSRIRNKRGKKRIEKLAKEEDGHRAILERRFRRLFGKDFQFNPDAEVGPRFDFVKITVFDQAGALEVVSVAISAENEAIQYYTQQLEAVTQPEDVKLLKRLVRFEETHKDKLQKEYRMITRRFTWAA